MAASEELRSCLHLVASASEAARRDCLAQIRTGDRLVFIDAGVMHLLSHGEAGSHSWPDLCAFNLPDLEARGLAGLAQEMGVTTVDDRGVAAGMKAMQHCVTWK